MNNFYTFLPLFSHFIQAHASWSYGVISFNKAGFHDESTSYCIVYEDEFQQLPQSEKEAEAIDVSNYTDLNFCDSTQFSNRTVEIQGRLAVTLHQVNCSVCALADTAQSHGAAGILILQNKTEEPFTCTNESDITSSLNITVARMLQIHYDSSMGPNMSAKLYAPVVPRWDYTLVVIWLMATGTVAVGAYWSGAVIHELRMKKRGSSQRVDDPLEASPLAIVILVIMMCTMLLLLYFFYDYLVYVIIVMFTLACSISLYGCIFPLYERIAFLGDCRIPANKLPLLKKRPRVKCLILGALCLGAGVAWAVFRNEPYAWIFQNILGITFCVQMMKTIRLPSLKACTVLLGLLFFYDIFFVFITPLFTKSGDSIMVKVATGGNSKSGEMLPMVLKVPHMSFLMRVCNQLDFSLLGFGDILVPGLLVSYNHGFDLKLGGKKIYYIASLIAYGLGMVATFIALALMETGQPALLYLVPFTLLTTYSIALCRKQFKHMWYGHLEKKPSENKKKTKTESPCSTVTPSRAAENVVNGNQSETSDEEATLLVNPT